MNKDRIAEMVDKNILKGYIDGLTTQSVVYTLNNKIKNLKTVLLNEKPSIDFEKMMDTEWDNIEGVRIRYTVFYVKHSIRRIEDLRWLDQNKPKFKQLSNSQIFNLIKLKEKLSI